MRLWQRIFPATLITVLMASAAPASAGALVDPFDNDTYRLSDSARDQLKAAVRKVLESGTPGTTAEWRDDANDRAGRATLLRSYERDGMRCGEVEHEYTDGKGARYVLPFCQTGDGTWKVAF